MSNDDLEKYVKEELHWDPKVDGEAIAVSVEDGVVTLKGTVGSFREKRAAMSSAERVYGVARVDNALQVRLLDENAREDAELRGDVLQALMLDSVIPSTVEATVDEGFVTLAGTAQWQHQRTEAETVASKVRGVLEVWNDIALTGPEPSADDVEHSIKKAFKRSAKVDAEGLTVETSDRTVTLKGTVSSWAEHDEAVATAWAAPGVQKVKDHILVAY